MNAHDHAPYAVTTNARLAPLVNEIKSLSGVSEVSVSVGCVVAQTSREALFATLQILKMDSRFKCNLLLDVTAVDWLDQRTERFELVYHLYSIELNHRIRLKVAVPEHKPAVASACSLWSGANYLEREVWDMYGISFEGHPDPRRILMYDEFVGHPLRKDYPVQGKQPRIPLRAPEVRNTAVDLKRPDLVQISRRAARP